MDARDEFYKALNDDLTDNERKSVLYQYLDGEQEKRVSGEGKRDLGKARSYQLRIRYYRKQLRDGEISPEEYLKQLLDVLLQKPQFAKSPGKKEKDFGSKRRTVYIADDPEPYISEMLKIALGCESSEKKGNFKQNMKQVYDILHMEKGAEYEKVMERLGKKEFWNPPFKKLMKLTDTILDVAMSYDIKEFFFDTMVEKQDGYTVAKRRKDFGRDSDKSRPERTDKSLKLIDYYCRQKGKTLFGTGFRADSGVPSDMECDALYNSLRFGKNEEVFVPLRVDNITGCGIYIIGKAYFEGEYADDPKGFQEIKESCAYGVIFFDQDYGEDIRTGYHISNKFGEFPNYISAYFDSDWSYEKLRQDTEDAIKETNGKMPSGISEAFRKYFEYIAKQEDEKDRQEVRRQVADCERELRKHQQNQWNRYELE